MKTQAIVLLVIIFCLFLIGIVSAGQQTGALFIWGDNSFGQRTNIPAGDDFVSVAAGRYHTIALHENGTLVAWGDNMYGQCNVPAGNTYTVIAAGGMNSMALRQDGSIVAWGDNGKGQNNVPPGNNYKAIAVGWSGFGVALRNNGTLVAWGDNQYGQCNVPAGNNYTAVSSGDIFSLALRADGSIVAWGLDQFGECDVPAGNDFSAVSAGGSSALALKTDGTVVGWGMNNANQCDAPPGNGYRSVVSGDQFSCALRGNNSIVIWGETYYMDQPPLGDNYFSLSTGQYHTAALHSPLRVSASVSGGHGTADPPSQTATFLSTVNVSFTPDHGYFISSVTDNGVAQPVGTPYTISGIRGDHVVVVSFTAIPSEYTVNAMVIGDHGTVSPSQQTIGIHKDATITINPDPGYRIGAIFDNGVSQQVSDDYTIRDVVDTHDIVVIFTLLPGSLRAWGYNDQGSCNVPPGDNYTAIASSWGSSLALRNGTLHDWGDNQYGQHNVPAGNNYLAVATGYFHNLALRQDGSIAAWGNNQYGQCNVPAGTSYAAISAGGWHSLAIATNGSLVAWGESTGVAPSGNDFSAIASGWYHNLALRQDGSIVAWGNNHVGQCNAPPGNDFVAVSGGGYHSLALRENGSIVAWGDNQYGECNAPAGNDFIAVSAGGYFSLALRQDGNIVAWGANDSGQCDVPAGNFSSISGGYEHSLAIAPATGAPVAGFSATPKSGKSPLQVQFNDTSSGAPPLSYEWNFGDGTPNVTVQNPVHTYTTGFNLTFNAVQTVTNSQGTRSTACYIQVNAEETPTVYWAPWVTKTNTTSGVINWWQETQGSGWTVQYATASYYEEHGKFDHIITDPGPANFHHVLLTGLEPNTTYKYLVGPMGSDPSGINQVFSVRQFQTFPVSGPFSFIVISDTHAQEQRFRYVADALANESGVLFILDGGDYASHDVESQWAYYYGFGNGMLANFSLYTSIGNHEYHNGTAENVSTDAYYYRNSFVNPLYYSFDCAGIRFVSLDSPDPTNHNDENPTRAHSEALAPWLKDQLDNTLYGTFVIHHHPVWTVGHEDADSALQPWEALFHTYNISAHFDGHIHTYQRFSVEGIPYFVVANAGGGFVSLTDKPVPPSYVYGATKELGYLKVTVDQANNTATANEYFVCSLPDYDSITGTVISPPRLADTITFPLRSNPPPDPSGIPITAPAVISTPGHYRLTNDLTNSTVETAIRITAPDVLLDGNGHTLDGNGSSDSTGVLISGGSAGTGNVTVRGLTVSGWQAGIEVNNQAGGEIEGCNATRNLFGIYLDHSREIMLKGVNASGNTPKNGGGGTGITFYNSPSCIVSCSTISRNGWGGPVEVGGYGVLLDLSPGTTISGCTINGNLNTAIEDDSGPSDLLLTRNIMSENGGNGGIFLGTLHSNRTQNCTISENHLSKNPAGITVDQADNCVMNQNDVTGGGVGISIVSSRNATLTGNTMTGNQYNLEVYGTEEPYYQHMIGTSNTVNGKPVYYLFQKPGAVVDATSRAGTVYGIGSPGITIRDVTLTDSTTGVLLFNSDSAQVQNVTTGGNQVGISISGCNDLVVNNSISSGNSFTGFDIQDSSNVTLRGVTANENSNPLPETGSGISIDTGSNLYIINATVDRNKYAGIEISGSDRTTLFGITASRNGIAGLVINGDRTRVMDCRIKDNGVVGIGLTQSHDSMIVNNWFSNAVNVGIVDGVTGTTWNTPKTTGTNIVNGPYLGGNYWAKPDGTGWSQVTPDRGDGFCNAPFTIDANNTDYLPLHAYIPQPNDYNLTLGEGWNMVSVPKKLAPGYDTGSIFKDVNTEGRTIWEYGGVIHNWVPIYADTPVLPLYGFWIYSKYPATVPLKFDPNPLQVPQSRNLVKGWELIGFTGTIPASARDTLLSVQNNWTQAMGFDTTAYQYEVQIINGGSGQFSDSRLMYPTKGYWLFMTGPGDLSAIGG